MSNTRYGHTGVGGGDQDQAERKDEGWTSRQGGDESTTPGRSGDPRPSDPEPGRAAATTPPRGTNTQGDLAGIDRASDESGKRLDEGRDEPELATSTRERDARGAGTDQPPRMGGPLGSDPDRPHLPEGAQDTESRGSGAGGFDIGVNAKNVGAVHQGVREEDEPTT